MDDLGRKTEIPLSGFSKPITGDIRSLRMNAPMPNNSDVRDQLSSEAPDLAVGLGGKTGTPVSGFSKPITGLIFDMFVRTNDGMRTVCSRRDVMCCLCR